MMIPLIKNTFYHERETKRELIKFIKSAQILSLNQQVLEFEKQFGLYQDRKYALMMNSGSSANLAIIQALLNLGMIYRGDRVGFSAVTWSTNVMPLIQLGLEPVPVDVNLDTLNLDINNLERSYRQTPFKMLFLTHLLGLCDEQLGAIVKFCRDKQIILIEDSCEALGSEYGGKKLGNFGLAATFSFYVGHHLSTIEGGMVVTNHKRLAEMLTIVRAHGWDRNMQAGAQQKIRARHGVNTTFYSRYTFYDLGYNLRSTEINGYLGLIGLKYLPEIVAKREKNFLRFARATYSQSDKYWPIKYDHMDSVSAFALPVICKSESIRQELVAYCDQKAETRPIVGGSIPEQPFFKKRVKGKQSWKLPISDMIHRQGLYLGNNPDLTGKELSYLIKLVNH